MKIEGIITIEYDSSDEAGMIAPLLELDNKIAPKSMDIATTSKGRRVTTRIKSYRLSTFFSTLDDLFFSEKLIKEITRIE